MPSSSQLLFPPFRLDLSAEQLWRDVQMVPLRPKALAVLRYLAEHPGRLARKPNCAGPYGATPMSVKRFYG